MAEPSSQDPDDTLLKHMNRLVERGLLDRSAHQASISDCYKYAMPWRHKFNDTNPGKDMSPIFDVTAGTVLEDFAANMLNTFTPQKKNWLEEQPVATLPIEVRRLIEKPLAERKQIVFAEMSRSPLYQALQEAYLDLGVGTMVLIVTDPDGAKPIHVEAIPAPDMILVRGPYGSVDAFRRKTYLRSEVMVLWPDANMSLLGPEPSKDSADPDYEVTDGCWRDWTDRGDETYHYVVAANGKRLYHKEYKGPGSNPFIIARWSRDSTTAIGIGPTYRTLPAIKTLNYWGGLSLKLFDQNVNPALSYEHDGVANFDFGIVPGTAIPREVGSKAPEAIESKTRFDVKAFDIDEMRSVIRRAHYEDRPEQLGKTPATATQWTDEAAERARRMGTPATNLVVELQIPLYRRFAYLLGKGQRNVLPMITENGKEDGRLVAIEPISPLLQAQEQSQIVLLDKFLEMITVRFGPQAALVLVNSTASAKWLAERFGIPLGLLNDPDQLKAAMQQFAPVIENFARGAGGGEVAPPPVGALQ